MGCSISLPHTDCVKQKDEFIELYNRGYLTKRQYNFLLSAIRNGFKARVESPEMVVSESVKGFCGFKCMLVIEKNVTVPTAKIRKRKK